ncbi:MAG: aminotransferase class I/II-fold pyridoxal phosphate-dependent enzyme [Spirochaetia bacterium]
MPKPTDFSLADFHLNDSPNVLEPPADYLEWIQDPGVRSAFTFFEQQLLGPPKSTTEILSNIDSKRRGILNMTSYNYLGLSTHPEVIQAAHETLDEYGLGASGAPLLSGTFDLHVELARRLAEFKQKDDCMVFSSGYGGNLGALQGMMRKGDVIAMDERSHKSVIDGATLSGAKKVFFSHNDPEDLAAQLEKHKHKRILVVLEGVYSMDGDLCRLPELADVADSFEAGIYLDEAHSTLMFGEHGRGVAEHFGMEDRVGVSYGTLSKSFGGVGGFVCANARLINYLKGYASAWNFSCSPPPAVVGGLIKSLEVATRDSSLRDKLWENTRYFRSQLDTLGLDTGECQSQVIPIIIGASGEKLFKYASEMQQRGLFLQPIDYPAVPAHKRRFRVSMSSQFEKEDLDRALNIIEDVIVAESD